MTDENFFDEHYIKRGDPSRPTYYVIRPHWPDIGLFADFNLFAGHIRYALTKGWLPVIDMQHYDNPYLPPEKLGKENAWEYFFEQPLRIGLEYAYNGENIVVNEIGKFGSKRGFSILIPSVNKMSLYNDKDIALAEWRMLVKMGLLKIKDNILEEINSLYEKLFSPNDRVLGVHLRGTDYIALKPSEHPIPPPVEFAASIVAEKIQEWKCNKLFFSSEDKNFVDVFKSVFGDFCVTHEREYINYVPGNMTPRSRIDRENDGFLQGKDYLTEMVILSKCKSFITARCNGSLSVMMMAEHFENTYAFNLGRYNVIGLD